MLLQGRGDRRRESITIDSQGATRRQLMLIGGTQDQGVGTAHLLVQKADSVIRRII